MILIFKEAKKLLEREKFMTPQMLLKILISALNPVDGLIDGMDLGD